jgi:CHAT domain-containing protein
VDLYRYTDFRHDAGAPGKQGEKRVPCYAAFVLRPGKDIARIELKEAAPIEEAWAAWHKAITTYRPDEAEREAAARLRALVWEPLRDALPSPLKTVYLAPDGPLHMVPWGALPGPKTDTVLLDECAICLVPHGPFLLERLQEKRADHAGDTLMAYGGVDYDGEPAALLRPEVDVRGPAQPGTNRVRWSQLPGTAREQEQVVALAKKTLRSEPIVRSGMHATTKQLEEDLPRARYAHLATHGFFADPGFRLALQLDPTAFERNSQDRRGGARSPLVLSGLVLAGANRQGDDAAPDRGIMTAEALIGLRLEGLELVVLSGCEGGLGEPGGGGEGAYGLPRAFHVAGCRNVIASLWKNDDAATVALIVLFFRNLWQGKLDAAEALRQAQLTLYRHPEVVEILHKRGVGDDKFEESKIEKQTEKQEKPAAKPKRWPTAHWAAFILSGPGR